MGRWDETDKGLRFDEALKKVINNESLRNFFLPLGNPSEALKSVGIPDKEINILSSDLYNAASRSDSMKVEDFKGLAKALQKPVAIFRHRAVRDYPLIIVNIPDGKIPHYACLEIANGRESHFISGVRCLSDKDNEKWLQRIKQGKALYLDRKQIQSVINKVYGVDKGLAADYVIQTIVNEFDNPRKADKGISLDDSFDKTAVTHYSSAIRTDLFQGQNKEYDEALKVKAFELATGVKLTTKDEHPYFNGSIVLKNLKTKELPEGLEIGGDFGIENCDIQMGLPEHLIVHGDLKLVGNNNTLHAPLPTSMYVSGIIDGVNENALQDYLIRREIQKVIDDISSMEKSSAVLKQMADLKKYPSGEVYRLDRPVNYRDFGQFTHFELTKDEKKSIMLYYDKGYKYHYNLLWHEQQDVIKEIKDTLMQATYLSKMKNVIGDIFKEEDIRAAVKQKPWILDYAFKAHMSHNEKEKVVKDFMTQLDSGLKLFNSHEISEVMRVIRHNVIVEAIHQRVSDSGAKAFSAKQYDMLDKFIECSLGPVFGKEPTARRGLLSEVWNDCLERYPDIAKLPQEWIEDTRSELVDLYKGERRSEGLKY